MPIDTIIFEGVEYPTHQSKGFASQFAIPFAKHFCKGRGLDIGCGRHEWCFPGAIPIDFELSEYDATSYPHRHLDYIFSSHCLEHLPDWVGVLDYWIDSLKFGGVLFLYLPDYSQEYWRPWNNRKHVNVLTPEILRDYLKHKGFARIFTSGVDLNNSFMVVGEK